MCVQAIVDDVQQGGTKSLIAQALRLGDIKSENDPLILGPEAMKAAFDKLPEEDQNVLIRTTVCCFLQTGSSSQERTCPI